MRRSSLALVTVLALGLLATGCAADSAPPTGVQLPPTSGAVDYQLGGAYEPPDGVNVVARDRTDPPAEGAYSICYVNGFQTQPGELDAWPDEVLLRDSAGEVVFDPNWPDEALLDTSTDDSRDAIAAIVGPWIEGCADSGYDAVEFDNLDTYARSAGALTLDDNLALATRLVGIAHDRGLAAAQKNASEDAETLHATAGFDFAIAEECAVFDECGAYTEVYGDHVIDIEYSDVEGFSFDDACADPATPALTVLRDRELATPASEKYIFALCARG